jgi:hypothetical protein
VWHSFHGGGPEEYLPPEVRLKTAREEAARAAREFREALAAAFGEITH